VVPVEFEVPEGEWTPLIDSEQYVFMRRKVDGPNGLGIAWLRDVFDDPCSDGSSGATSPWATDSGPREFFEWLADKSPVDWGAPESTTIASKEALTIERLVPDGVFGDCAEELFPIVDVGVPAGQLSIPRYGQRFSLSAVQVGTHTLLILDFAMDGTLFQQHRGAANALIESITFPDAESPQ